MFQTCKSHADQSKCVSDLGNACDALKNKLGYSDPDARTVALNNIKVIASAGLMMLNFLHSWANGDARIRQIIPQLIGLKTVNQTGVKMAGDTLSTTGKLTLCVLSQFQIENALRNIARELRLADSGKGFYNCATSVLGALSIPADRMQILNTPARIRNSLHSNGIYHRQHPSEPSSVTIRGVVYEFKDGQSISCASWEHIAHALEASVGVLEEVFLAPKVQALADPIMDHYAWEQVTKPGESV